MLWEFLARFWHLGLVRRCLWFFSLELQREPGIHLDELSLESLDELSLDELSPVELIMEVVNGVDWEPLSLSLEGALVSMDNVIAGNVE